MFILVYVFDIEDDIGGTVTAFHGVFSNTSIISEYIVTLVDEKTGDRIKPFSFSTKEVSTSKVVVSPFMDPNFKIKKVFRIIKDKEPTDYFIIEY